LYEPDYVWHDLARVWQTPGEGEKLVATMMDGTVADRAGRMMGLGLPPAVAEAVAAAQGAEMGRCILALYRSAVQPVMAEVGRNLPAAAERPGLSILATDDPYAGTATTRRRAAARAGARTGVLEGLGHWWMLQDPQRSAGLLDQFINEVDG
jgi:pimeloyl-ACP methyl ester carboxylesterase